MPLDNANSAFTRLINISNRIYSLIADCEREDIFSPYEVVSRYKGYKNGKTASSVEEVAAEYLACIKPCEQTRLRIENTVKEFVKATNKQSIRQIIPDTLKGFEYELENNKQYASATVAKKLAYLKRVFNFAFHKKYITTNPYDFFKMPTITRQDLIQLSQDELAYLSKYNFKSEKLEKVKDLFLFQCYTGLAYSDIVMFSKEIIVESKGISFLKGKRVKNSQGYFLPWLPEAAAIAEKYAYNLPVLSNQKYNEYLKEIAEITAIEKSLTTHVGRKTFAQVMLDKGYTIDAVSKMIGHADVKMTQRHYARIGETRIEKEVLDMMEKGGTFVKNAIPEKKNAPGIPLLNDNETLVNLFKMLTPAPAQA